MTNQNTTAFKSVVFKLFQELKTMISEEVLSSPESDLESRCRKTVIVFNDRFIKEINRNQYPVVDLYREAIELVLIELSEGYGPDVVNLEVFNHQAVDWVLMRIEELHKGTHAWSDIIKINPNYVACVSIGFGSIPSESRKEIALLPMALQQVIKLTDDEEAENELILYNSWDLSKDGVLVDTDVLKRFGL